MLGTRKETKEYISKLADIYKAVIEKQANKYNSKWPDKYKEKWLNKVLETYISKQKEMREILEIEFTQLKKEISKQIYEDMMLRKTKLIRKG